MTSVHEPFELDAAVTAALFPLLNNLYFVHLDIVDVCAKWVPRRTRDDERFWLANQLRRETEEVPMYRALVAATGREPDAAWRIPDSRERYARLKETDDELNVAVGMNVVAQGVLGALEHRQLYAYNPVLFAPLVETIAFETGNLERVKVFLRRRDPEQLSDLMLRYHRHLLEVSIPTIMPLLEPVLTLGIFQGDIVQEGLERFAAIAVDVDVTPPVDLRSPATDTALAP
jgi:hypothetical protein